MSFYKKDGHDYGGRVSWEEPPPYKQERGCAPVLVVLVVIVMGYFAVVNGLSVINEPTTQSTNPAPVTVASTDNSVQDIARDEPKNKEQSTMEGKESEAIDVKTPDKISFYQTQKITLVPEITCSFNYRVEWIINQDLTHLHCQTDGPLHLKVWASGLIHRAAPYDDIEDGRNAITLMVYNDSNQEVAAIQKIHIRVDYPLLVLLSTASDKQASTITPEVRWEGQTVFGPSPYHPKSPPDGMIFTWRYLDEVISREPTCQPPVTDGLSDGKLQVQVDYRTFSSQAELEL